MSPALRVIGNIVTGDDTQTQHVINIGALQSIKHLFSNSKNTIKKEACWTISNVTAGSADQIQAVIDAGLIPKLIYALHHEEFKTKKEACWALSNATSARMERPDQIRYLVSVGVIKPLCDILLCTDNKIILVALDALLNILEVGEQDSVHHDGHNPYAISIEEANGVDKIFNLQSHQNEEIYLKAKSMLDKYFSADEEEAVVDVNNSTFQFSNTSDVPQGGFRF